MLPDVSKLRTQPPDRPIDDQAIVNRDEGQFPSLDVNRVNRGTLPKATGESNGEGSKSMGDNRGKVQHISSNFTRESLLLPREEEWMEDDEVVPETVAQETQSYREPLSPNSTKGSEKAKRKEADEVWFGTLIF